MEMDFSSTHTGCKGRSQSGVALPGQTPGMILLPLPSSCSQHSYFHSASSPCPPHCSLHTYQYLLQREIFTAFLPLLALYKGTHISFGVFERNNTHKHLPATGHRNLCRGGQQGTEENNETPTQRHDSRAGWPRELLKVCSCLEWRFLSFSQWKCKSWPWVRQRRHPKGAQGLRTSSRKTAEICSPNVQALQVL